MAKHERQRASAAAHEQMERSEEVAHSAAPQGDGQPDPRSGPSAPDDSYLTTDGSAAGGTGSGSAAEETVSEVVADDQSVSGTATAAPRSSGGGSELAAERDRYLRLAAEYDNFRKRTARERAESGTRAQGELVKQLVDPLDDLARFAHLDPATVDAATVVHGVELVERKLLKALTAAGLEIVTPQDQPFDPSLHEAVSTEPALSREDDHMVARVYQAGYLFKGQLLRPARVVVKQWNG